MSKQVSPALDDARRQAARRIRRQPARRIEEGTATIDDVCLWFNSPYTRKTRIAERAFTILMDCIDRMQVTSLFQEAALQEAEQERDEARAEIIRLRSSIEEARAFAQTRAGIDGVHLRWFVDKFFSQEESE